MPAVVTVLLTIIHAASFSLIYSQISNIPQYYPLDGLKQVEKRQKRALFSVAGKF
jgi:hypothetical protein